MSNENKLDTVASISDYTKRWVDIYRQFPSRKSEVVEKLEVVFMEDDCWGKVIKENRFSAAFRQKMGRGRMQALNKLLNGMDKEHYSQVSFE